MNKSLFEAAVDYHVNTELYDRRICTGPMGRDNLQPTNKKEPGTPSGSLVLLGFNCAIACCATASFAEGGTDTDSTECCDDTLCDCRVG